MAGAILSLFMVGAAFGQESESSRVEIEAGTIGVLQGSPGFSGQFADTDSATKASVLLDLGLTVRPWESGTAHVWFRAGGGDGIDGVIPTFSIFNATAIGSNARLEEIWYEQAFGEKIRLRGGKIDITSAFDTNEAANDEYNQFLSGGFVNNLAMELPDDTGFGAMLWISPNTFFDIGVGIADTAGGWKDVFQNVFSIFELGLKSEIAGRQGNYRFYGWHNGNDHERLLSPDIADDANYGFGLSADQEIAENLTLFARYGRQRGSVSLIEQAWSAGISISGKFARREGDTLGFAYGQAVIGKDWKSLDPETGINSGNEHHLEIYYNIRANNHLNISPNVQWVKNPIGDKGNSRVWGGGIRAYFNLGGRW